MNIPNNPNEFNKKLQEELTKQIETFEIVRKKESFIKISESANETMRAKSYAEDNKAMFLIAKITSYFTSSFSVASGLYFLYSTFILILYFEVLSWILAASLLILLESAKHISSNKSFELFYRGRTPISYLFFVILLLCLSVFSSIKGVEKFYTQVMHEKPTLLNTGKIGLEYENRIKEIEKQRNEFVKSVSWNGTINIYDPQVRSSLTNFDSQITKLRTEKNNALNKAEKENNQKETESNSKHLTSVFYLILIFGTNEIFCLLSLWYVIYFKYRVYKEDKIYNAMENLEVVENQPTTPPLSQNKIQNTSSFGNNNLLDNLPKNNKDYYSTNNSTGFQIKAGTNTGTNTGINVGTNSEMQAGTDTGTNTGTNDLSNVDIKNIKFTIERLEKSIKSIEETGTMDGRVDKPFNVDIKNQYLKFYQVYGLDKMKEILSGLYQANTNANENTEKPKSKSKITSESTSEVTSKKQLNIF